MGDTLAQFALSFGKYLLDVGDVETCVNVLHGVAYNPKALAFIADEIRGEEIIDRDTDSTQSGHSQLIQIKLQLLKCLVERTKSLSLMKEVFQDLKKSDLESKISSELANFGEAIKKMDSKKKTDQDGEKKRKDLNPTATDGEREAKRRKKDEKEEISKKAKAKRKKEHSDSESSGGEKKKSQNDDRKEKKKKKKDDSEKKKPDTKNTPQKKGKEKGAEKSEESDGYCTDWRCDLQQDQLKNKLMANEKGSVKVQVFCNYSRHLRVWVRGEFLGRHWDPWWPAKVVQLQLKGNNDFITLCPHGVLQTCVWEFNRIGGIVRKYDDTVPVERCSAQCAQAKREIDDELRREYIGKENLNTAVAIRLFQPDERYLQNGQVHQMPLWSETPDIKQLIEGYELIIAAAGEEEEGSNKLWWIGLVVEKNVTNPEDPEEKGVRAQWMTPLPAHSTHTPCFGDGTQYFSVLLWNDFVPYCSMIKVPDLLGALGTACIQKEKGGKLKPQVVRALALSGDMCKQIQKHVEEWFSN